MTNLTLTISDETANNMLINLPRSVKLTDVVSDAMSLYLWAIEERKKGRVICSADIDLTDVRQITTDSLDSIKI